MTHVRRIITYAIVTFKIYVIRERRFLPFSFGFYLFFFYIYIFFLFLFGNSQSSIMVTLPLVMFYSRGEISAITYSDLTFNPFTLFQYFRDFNLFYYYKLYFIRNSHDKPSSSYRHWPPPNTFSHVLYFQASLLNYFINILLISVPHTTLILRKLSLILRNSIRTHY